MNCSTFSLISIIIVIYKTSIYKNYIISQSAVKEFYNKSFKRPYCKIVVSNELSFLHNIILWWITQHLSKSIQSVQYFMKINEKISEKIQAKKNISFEIKKNMKLNLITYSNFVITINYGLTKFIMIHLQKNCMIHTDETFWNQQRIGLAMSKLLLFHWLNSINVLKTETILHQECTILNIFKEHSIAVYLFMPWKKSSIIHKKNSRYH